MARVEAGHPVAPSTGLGEHGLYETNHESRRFKRSRILELRLCDSFVHRVDVVLSLGRNLCPNVHAAST